MSLTVVQSQDSIVSWGVLTGAHLDCLDKNTGALRWKWTPPCKGSVVTSGPFDSGVVYAGTSSTHNFYAVNASNGVTIWSANTGGEMWGTLGALVVKDKNMVCVGAGGNAVPSLDEKARVVCLERATGKIVWSSRTGKQIQSRPSYVGDTLFVGDYDGCMYAMSLETGARRWKTCTGKIIEGSSLVVGNKVIFPRTMALSTPSMHPLAPGFGMPHWAPRPSPRRPDSASVTGRLYTSAGKQGCMPSTAPLEACSGSLQRQSLWEVPPR